MDVIYNPLRTKLLLQAQEMGIPCCNGLEMLVAQAKYAAELFLDRKFPTAKSPRPPQAVRTDGKHRPDRHALLRQDHHS